VKKRFIEFDFNTMLLGFSHDSGVKPRLIDGYKYSPVDMDTPLKNLSIAWNKFLFLLDPFNRMS